MLQPLGYSTVSPAGMILGGIHGIDAASGDLSEPDASSDNVAGIAPLLSALKDSQMTPDAVALDSSRLVPALVSGSGKPPKSKKADRPKDKEAKLTNAPEAGVASVTSVGLQPHIQQGKAVDTTTAQYIKAEPAPAEKSLMKADSSSPTSSSSSSSFVVSEAKESHDTAATAVSESKMDVTLDEAASSMIALPPPFGQVVARKAERERAASIGSGSVNKNIVEDSGSGAGGSSSRSSSSSKVFKAQGLASTPPQQYANNSLGSYSADSLADREGGSASTNGSPSDAAAASILNALNSPKVCCGCYYNDR